MLVTRQIIPEAMHNAIGHDQETEAYYAELRELEQDLERIAQECGLQDKSRQDDGSPLELTDYLLIEDI